MEWQIGLKRLSSIMFNGKEYSLTVLKQDVGIKNYYVRLVEGDWQLPYDQQTAIAMVIFPDVGDVDDLINTRLAALNEALTAYFGGIVPVTFLEKLEAALSRWALVIENNIPQVKTF